MSRIIWRRVRSEWVGRLAAGGPDRFSITKVRRHAPPFPMWSLRDMQTERAGVYAQLRHAKAAAETMR